ncbi:MAG TPA: response regulator, partial [Casimicrobiaceae bacterium]
AVVTYRALLSTAGYSVAAVHSVREALDVLDERTDIRLVISDVRMPDVDGLDLVRVLRHRFPMLPCILLTGAAMTGEDVVPREALILRKPVPVQALERAIREKLEASKAA